MGLLDNLFDKDDNKEKKKADFSGVVGGSSTTAPKPNVEEPPPRPADVGRTYTVVAGDTLSKIAQREYGDAGQWKRIYEANKDAIKNPDLIHPGDRIRVAPPREEDEEGGVYQSE